ncbi:MAG: AAA family ATPase [Patescibacteria group bacterium]|nr:AAA family ATPase [Patescibacteria group bacterium]
MTTINLSKDQKEVLSQIYNWTKKPTSPYITLGGYAGVGKTTLMAEYRRLLNKKKKKFKVAFVSYTGRATRVLNSKLKTGQAIFKQDKVSTIHSLIYSPVLNSKQAIVGWKLKESLEFDLIVIDEASMVDQHLWKDILSFNLPIVAVGDHGQLPPIKGNFNLMENPMVRLEKIHRQAQDNPIIKLSLLARENGHIPIRQFGDKVIKIDKNSFDSKEQIENQLQNYSPDTIILCGYNKTRTKLNQFIRRGLGFESQDPIAGDRVICLKNNHKKNIFNGMLGTIQFIKSKNQNWYQTEILMDDEADLFQGLIYKDQFGNKSSLNFTHNRSKHLRGDLFDFGYSLTVHKAQGSQAKKVILFEERFPKMDDLIWKRWLYTAVTRAEQELFIVS